MQNVRRYVFLAGAAIAILAALIPKLERLLWLRLVLMLLGLAVGFLYLKSDGIKDFLIALIGLILIAGVLELKSLSPTIFWVLRNVLLFLAPAGLVLAFKAIWDFGVEK